MGSAERSTRRWERGRMLGRFPEMKRDEPRAAKEERGSCPLAYFTAGSEVKRGCLSKVTVHHSSQGEGSVGSLPFYRMLSLLFSD